LKKNTAPFEVVDGSMAGRKFTHNVEYDEIPANEKIKFDPVKKEAAKAKTGKDDN
jgi:hypothetical protein